MVVLFGGLPSAAASQGDASLRLAAEVANANRTSDEGPHFGFGAETRAVFGLSDFFSLTLGAEGTIHPAASPGDDELEAMVVQDVFGGFRYNLDIFVYVPYVGVSMVAYPLEPRSGPGEDQRGNVGAKLTVGVDWRFSRYWSIGGLVELHSVAFEVGDFPSYSTVGFNVSYHFRL